MAVAGFLLFASAAEAAARRPSYSAAIPRGLPSELPSPADNPLSAGKVALGRELFFEKRLSRDGTLSCASCHSPEKGFSNGERVATGIGGRLGDRNVPTLVNRAWSTAQFWDGRAPSLEAQALFPLTHPDEMGNTAEEAVLTLKSIPSYVSGFQAAFGETPDAANLAKALSAFERTIFSGDSDYDRYQSGDRSALSPAAARGMALFFERFKCSSCHSGPNFTNEQLSPRCYPKFGAPREAEAAKSAFKSRFKTPTLRDVALTAPYMHNGRLATLEEAVEFYNHSGPLPDEFTGRKEFPDIEMSAEERADLVAFLRSLTGRKNP